jgi:hypothetical protein
MKTGDTTKPENTAAGTEALADMQVANHTDTADHSEVAERIVVVHSRSLVSHKN